MRCHGVLSRYTVLPWEDADEYHGVVAALVTKRSPRHETSFSRSAGEASGITPTTSKACEIMVAGTVADWAAADAASPGRPRHRTAAATRVTLFMTCSLAASPLCRPVV